MESIQCPHCQKQYAVNDKLRAAVGKKIRCKHCSQPFEILIQQSSTDNSGRPTDNINEDLFKSHVTEESDHTQQAYAPKDTALEHGQKEDSETKNEATDTTEAVKTTKSAKNKVNIQLIITIVLAVTLLISAIAAYLFLTQPDLFKTTAPKKEIQGIIPENMFKPIEIKIAPATPGTMSQKAVKEATPIPKPALKKKPKLVTSTPTKSASKAKEKPIKKFMPSQACKDVAAEYWVRSHQLATESLDTGTYMKLLDKNIEQADDIRLHCKEKALVGLISKASRTDIKPGWISKEIYALIDASQAKPKKNREADLF